MIAKALPVRDLTTKTQKGQKGQKGKKPQQKPSGPDTKKPSGPATSRNKRAREDDTPKAFQRLMQYQTTGRRAPSGLETGEKRENKKRKREAVEAKKDSASVQKKGVESEKEQVEAEAKALVEAAAKVVAKKEMPKILPGEKMSDFAARVDRELPLSAITRASQAGTKVRDHKMTKHEKHLRRLQEGWRKDDARIKEKEAAEREEKEFEMADELELLKEWERDMRGGKAKKKNLKKGDDEDTVDPWAKLKKRDKERQANPFDVAQAPPELAKPREIFKVRGGAKVDVANVPNAVGSLRRREELAGERRSIVEEYRRLMAAKRGEV